MEKTQKRKDKKSLVQIFHIHLDWTGVALGNFIITRGMIKTQKYNFFYRVKDHLVSLCLFLATDYSYRFGQSQGRFYTRRWMG